MQKIILSFLFIFSIQAGEIVETLFGTINFDEEPPVVRELVAHKAMQRIKEVDQSGPARYTDFAPPYSRFEHCVGVYALLKKYGASLEEQVAGLLHDASHTAFSHAGDHVYDHEDGDKSYQDTIHNRFLKEMGVDKVLERHGMTIEGVNPDREEFKALEQDLPTMCADRIEYNLHTGFVFKFITQKEVDQIVEALHFDGGSWYFTDRDLAEKFAKLSLHFTENFWGNAENFMLNHWIAKALRRARSIELIKDEDILYGKDREVLSILESSEDREIKKALENMYNVKDSYHLITDDSPAYIEAKQKFRGVNPWVKSRGAVDKLRLTMLAPWFAQEYGRVRDKAHAGYRIGLNEGALIPAADIES